MFRSTSELDWQIVDDEDFAKCETSIAIPENPSAPHRGTHLVPILALVAVLLLVVLSAGHRLTRRAEQNIAQTQTEIESLMDAENWARQDQNTFLANSLLDPHVPESRQRFLRTGLRRSPDVPDPKTDSPLPAVQSMELKGDLAMVEVMVYDSEIPWLTAPYRQTRFYRQTAQGWLRTAPQAAFWGEAQHLETAHLRFEYHRRDADAVQVVAGKIEDLYAEQHRLLGLRPAPLDTKTTIVVSPEVEPRTDTNCVHYACDRPVVPSPHLLPLHEGIPPDAALQKLVAAALAMRTLEEALEEKSPLRRWMWHPIVLGLGQWIGNRYNDLPSERKCELRGYVDEWLAAHPVANLDTLAGPHCGDTYLPQPSPPVHCSIAGSTTMIDYAVAQYGGESLPLLLDALQQHDSWQSLIPAVYGVPVDEFEAGWQTHLESLRVLVGSVH